MKPAKNWSDREIEASLQQFKAEQGPLRRYASFDYCFNYFQSYREQGRAEELAENMQVSCLHLGFYLASWGMFRGGSVLLTRSVRQFEPVIKLIARVPRSIWEIDADEYTAEACEALAKAASDIREALAFPNGKWPSPTLATKIMLGVFGNVPAFDSRVRRGLRDSDMTGRFGPGALRNIGRFYHAHRQVIDLHRDPTLDFGSQQPTGRTYTRAKVIDEIFYIKGGGTLTEIQPNRFQVGAARSSRANGKHDRDHDPGAPALAARSMNVITIAFAQRPLPTSGPRGRNGCRLRPRTGSTPPKTASTAATWGAGGRAVRPVGQRG